MDACQGKETVRLWGLGSFGFPRFWEPEIVLKRTARNELWFAPRREMAAASKNVDFIQFG